MSNVATDTMVSTAINVMKSLGFRDFDKGVHATSAKLTADIINIWGLNQREAQSNIVWEIGMGEGYLAAALSCITNSKVVGTDIGEIKQQIARLITLW